MADAPIPFSVRIPRFASPPVNRQPGVQRSTHTRRQTHMHTHRRRLIYAHIACMHVHASRRTSDPEAMLPLVPRRCPAADDGGPGSASAPLLDIVPLPRLLPWAARSGSSTKEPAPSMHVSASHVCVCECAHGHRACAASDERVCLVRMRAHACTCMCCVCRACVEHTRAHTYTRARACRRTCEGAMEPGVRGGWLERGSRASCCACVAFN